MPYNVMMTDNGLKTWWKCTRCLKEFQYYDEISFKYTSFHGSESTYTYYELQAFWKQHPPCESVYEPETS